MFSSKRLEPGWAAVEEIVYGWSCPLKYCKVKANSLKTQRHSKMPAAMTRCYRMSLFQLLALLHCREKEKAREVENSSFGL